MSSNQCHRVPLTLHEQERKAKLIRVIKAGYAVSVRYHESLKMVQQTKEVAWEVAKAVHEINRDKLYKDTHSDFVDFCWDVLGAPKSWAYEQMDWVKLSDMSETRIDNPRQARELRRLPDELVKPVHDKATSGGTMPTTAAKLRTLVDEEMARLNPKDQLRIQQEMDDAIIEDNEREEAKLAPAPKTRQQVKEEDEAMFHQLRKHINREYDGQHPAVAETFRLIDLACRSLRKAPPRCQKTNRRAA